VPATAEPRKKLDATARSMLTPKADAVSKSCSVARHARPRRVLLMRNHATMSSATEATRTINWLPVTWAVSNLSSPSGARTGRGRTYGPAMRRKRSSMNVNMLMDTISDAMWNESCRLSAGRRWFGEGLRPELQNQYTYDHCDSQTIFMASMGHSNIRASTPILTTISEFSCIMGTLRLEGLSTSFMDPTERLCSLTANRNQ
jgi:hypothetical protein